METMGEIRGIQWWLAGLAFSETSFKTQQNKTQNTI